MGHGKKIIIIGHLKEFKNGKLNFVFLSLAPNLETSNQLVETCNTTIREGHFKNNVNNWFSLF